MEFENPSYNEKEQVLESGRARFERGTYQLYDHELITLPLWGYSPHVYIKDRKIHLVGLM